MNRADLSGETGPELCEDDLGFGERPEKQLHLIFVVASLGLVLVEGDGFGHFIGPGIDADGDADAAEEIEEGLIEIGDGVGVEGHAGGPAVVDVDDDFVTEKVQFDGEGSAGWMGLASRMDLGGQGHTGGSEAAGADVQRDMPGMVDPGQLAETDLADDLGP